MNTSFFFVFEVANRETGVVTESDPVRTHQPRTALLEAQRKMQRHQKVVGMHDCDGFQYHVAGPHKFQLVTPGQQVNH